MKRRTKVLVVDDDALSLEVTRARLVSFGYDVVTREDAVGTTAAVARENPDIVLLDVAMPGVSGEALARLISNDPKRKRVAVILHSARDEDDLQRLAVQCRALGGIQKTQNASMFRIRLERLLMNRAPLSSGSLRAAGEEEPTPPNGRKS
jgi:CheY-like chemotaxis protein